MILTSNLVPPKALSDAKLKSLFTRIKQRMRANPEPYDQQTICRTRHCIAGYGYIEYYGLDTFNRYMDNVESGNRQINVIGAIDTMLYLCGTEDWALDSSTYDGGKLYNWLFGQSFQWPINLRVGYNELYQKRINNLIDRDEYQDKIVELGCLAIDQWLEEILEIREKRGGNKRGQVKATP